MSGTNTIPNRVVKIVEFGQQYFQVEIFAICYDRVQSLKYIQISIHKK